MLDLLNGFWRWFGVSADDYAKAGSNAKFDKDEFFFPDFNQLVCSAKKILKKADLADNEIETVLTVMAIDNEAEDVLDMMVDILSDEIVEKVVAVGINHIQPNARWQLAVLIGRRKIQNGAQFLNILAKDVDEYVRKRARNELNYLT